MSHGSRRQPKLNSNLRSRIPLLRPSPDCLPNQAGNGTRHKRSSLKSRNRAELHRELFAGARQNSISESRRTLLSESTSKLAAALRESRGDETPGTPFHKPSTPTLAETVQRLSWNQHQHKHWRRRFNPRPPLRRTKPCRPRSCLPLSRCDWEGTCTWNIPGEDLSKANADKLYELLLASDEAFGIQFDARFIGFDDCCRLMQIPRVNSINVLMTSLGGENQILFSMKENLRELTIRVIDNAHDAAFEKLPNFPALETLRITHWLAPVDLRTAVISAAIRSGSRTGSAQIREFIGSVLESEVHLLRVSSGGRFSKCASY